MSERSISGKDVNAVINLLRDLRPDDGDAQLSILAYAFVIGCRSTEVSKDTAIRTLGELFEQTFELVNLDREH